MNRFIKTLYSFRRGLALLALVPFLGLGLTACKDTGDEPPPQEEPPPPPPPPPEPEPEPEPELPVDRCPPNCTLTVTLPADPSTPPEVSHPRFFAEGGADITIVLVDKSNRPGPAATVLRFPGESAFTNRGGQPMKTVTLNPGNNGFKIRDYGSACLPAQGGCKYDVINTGEPGRPALDPHMIIWR